MLRRCLGCLGDFCSDCSGGVLTVCWLRLAFSSLSVGEAIISLSSSISGQSKTLVDVEDVD